MANYILRNVEPELWASFKQRAASEGRALRWLLLEMIVYYVKRGLPTHKGDSNAP